MSKFGILSSDGKSMNRYDFDEVKLLQKHWKEEFRRKNRTDEVIKNGGIDRYYDQFCKQIDDFILKGNEECKKN